MSTRAIVVVAPSFVAPTAEPAGCPSFVHAAPPSTTTSPEISSEEPETVLNRTLVYPSAREMVPEPSIREDPDSIRTMSESATSPERVMTSTSPSVVQVA